MLTRWLQAVSSFWLMLVMCLAPWTAAAAALGHREVLPNGMILLASEQRAVPIVTATMLIQAGAILDPQDKPGVANLVAELLTHGTKTRTAPQISEAIEFVGGSLSVEAGQELTTVSLSLPSKDLDVGLDLMADVLLNPTFGQADLDRKRQEAIALIHPKKKNS